jgi:two-component system sensor histidine kinase CpxA
MKRFPGFPLLAKVLCWLVLHLIILGFAFFVFVRWQLGLGLDSLLSGSAGERLGVFGDAVVERLVDYPPHRWSEQIKPLAEAKHVSAIIMLPPDDEAIPLPIPPNILERARSLLPPPRPESEPPPRDGRRPPRQDSGPPDGPPDGPPQSDRNPDSPASSFLPKSRPVFLTRADNGDGYWAGVILQFPRGGKFPHRPVVLLVRSDRLDGSGMFFDFKPWLLGGIAVLLLSLAFWTPFVWGVARYIRRLTNAAGEIAAGRFDVSLPQRGNDELGDLGRTIQSMAARLDHFISGQKRFLSDAAHELCAPLARIRTGFGILETKLHGADASALASIETDVAELATLVNEILAFSRTGSRESLRKQVVLDELVREVLAREALGVDTQIVIPEGLSIITDPNLLGRAIGNLIRNASIHAGPQAKLSIVAMDAPESVSVTVSDNGPGVPKDELARIFEPFYRIDRSRSRDSGGSGLGLAIVRSAMESCGGEAVASLPETGGFAVTLRLPKQAAQPS